MRKRPLAILSLAAMIATAGASRSASQTPAAAAFEVASVKVNRSGAPPMMKGILLEPGGRATATNVTLEDLVQSAYSRMPFDHRQIAGGPSWIGSARFDVVARAAGNHVLDSDGYPRQSFLMLRTLLTDRFTLRTHEESRQAPVFELVLARSDKRLGPNLQPSTLDCAAIMEATRNGQRPKIEPGKGPPCSFGIPPGKLVATGATMSAFANVLSTRVDRPVIDTTGLAGAFDLHVEWSLTDDSPSIFTALQEQLGLKLEPATGPVDVVVIDSVEMPTEN